MWQKFLHQLALNFNLFELLDGLTLFQSQIAFGAFVSAIILGFGLVGVGGCSHGVKGVVGGGAESFDGSVVRVEVVWLGEESVPCYKTEFNCF